VNQDGGSRFFAQIVFPQRRSVAATVRAERYRSYRGTDAGKIFRCDQVQLPTVIDVQPHVEVFAARHQAERTVYRAVDTTEIACLKGL
jgi:hypothetical protein